MSSELKTTLTILCRAFAIAALAVFFDKGGDVFALDAESGKAIVSAGVAAVAWTVFSWLNPRDSRIGIGSGNSEQ
jgi:hypothetical protein